VANVSATLGLDGRVTITSDSADFEFSFSEDSSGVLAALGINTFFTGSNLSDMNVNQRLIDDPMLLAAGQDHVTGDNANALALAGVGDVAVASLGGVSLRDHWARHVQDFAVRAAQANQNVDATSIVAESLTTQKQSVSGVNLDEEAINMLSYQRGYQAAARFITVVDELTQVMLGMLR
jgi:flagellar hook-associated protein 1 FlgK